MEVTLKLKQSDAQIQRLIMRAFVNELDSRFALAIPRIKEKIITLVLNKIALSTTVASLLGGPLRGELGVVDPPEKLRLLFDIWKEEFLVKYSGFVLSGRTIKTDLEMSMIDGEFKAALNSGQFEFQSDPSDEIIPWLEWLLTAGTQRVVTGYHVSFDLNSFNSVYSRTGLAIMKKKGSYGVNSQDAGTVGDNFVSRAIDDIVIGELYTIFGAEL